jgi:hypothetical protein
MIIYINGRGMNAPELKAYISELEAENEKLRAKVESDNLQIAEYKRLLKAAVDDLNNIGSCKTCVKFGDICRGCRTDYKWVHADEALALIGEEGERNG